MAMLMYDKNLSSAAYNPPHRFAVPRCAQCSLTVQSRSPSRLRAYLTFFFPLHSAHALCNLSSEMTYRPMPPSPARQRNNLN